MTTTPSLPPPTTSGDPILRRWDTGAVRILRHIVVMAWVFTIVVFFVFLGFAIIFLAHGRPTTALTFTPWIVVSWWIAQRLARVCRR
jgi:hypothetical protein